MFIYSQTFLRSREGTRTHTFTLKRTHSHHMTKYTHIHTMYTCTHVRLLKHDHTPDTLITHTQRTRVRVTQNHNGT